MKTCKVDLIGNYYHIVVNREANGRPSVFISFHGTEGDRESAFYTGDRVEAVEFAEELGYTVEKD